MSNSEIHPAKLLKSLSDNKREPLDWRGENSQVEAEAVLSQPFKVAEKYLKENLKNLFSPKTLDNSKN